MKKLLILILLATSSLYSQSNKDTIQVFDIDYNKVTVTNRENIFNVLDSLAKLNPEFNNSFYLIDNKLKDTIFARRKDAYIKLNKIK